MTIERELKLSPEGETRREKMAGELQTSFKRLHRNRSRNRVIAATVAVGMLLGGLALFFQQNSSPGYNLATPDSNIELPSKEIVKQPYDHLEHITVEVISDKQLLAMLKESGQPSSLITVDGRKVVIPDRGKMRP